MKHITADLNSIHWLHGLVMSMRKQRGGEYVNFILKIACGIPGQPAIMYASQPVIDNAIETLMRRLYENQSD